MSNHKNEEKMETNEPPNDSANNNTPLATINEDSILNSDQELKTYTEDELSDLEFATQPEGRRTRNQTTKDYQAMNSGKKQSTNNKQPNNNQQQQEINKTNSAMETKLKQALEETQNDLTEAKAELKSMKKKNNKYKEEVANKNKIIQQLQQQNEILRGTATKAEEELNEMKKRQTSMKPTDEEAITIKPRVHLIIDSNRKTITPNLTDSIKTIATITEDDNTYTTTQLRQAINKNQNNNSIKVILIGTNDVRMGERETPLANLDNISRQIDQDTTIICTIPQMSVRTPVNTKLNTNLINTTIKTLFKNTVDLHEKITPEMLDHDGYHLNNKGGKAAAEAIAEKTTQLITTLNNTHNNRPTNNTTTITIREDMVGHVLGKGRRNVITITQKHEVDMEIEGNGKGIKITITGNNDNRKAAIKQIKDTMDEQIEERTKQNATKDKMKDSICTYHQNGTCKYGDKCWKKHPQMNNTTPATPYRPNNNTTTPKTREEQSRPSSNNQTNNTHNIYRPAPRPNNNTTTPTTRDDLRRPTNNTQSNNTPNTYRPPPRQDEPHIRPTHHRRQEEPHNRPTYHSSRRPHRQQNPYQRQEEHHHSRDHSPRHEYGRQREQPSRRDRLAKAYELLDLLSDE